MSAAMRGLLSGLGEEPQQIFVAHEEKLRETSRRWMELGDGPYVSSEDWEL